MRPRQHAQRQRRDEEPQRKREIRLFEQLEIDASAGAEKHRQPQEPAPLLGVELRRKRPPALRWRETVPASAPERSTPSAGTELLTSNT